MGSEILRETIDVDEPILRISSILLGKWILWISIVCTLEEHALSGKVSHSASTLSGGELWDMDPGSVPASE